MDIKTRFEEDKYNEVVGIKNDRMINKISSSIELLKNENINYQLRTTIMPNLHTNETCMQQPTQQGNV